MKRGGFDPGTLRLCIDKNPASNFIGMNAILHME
jgi:hypothetical protein